MLSLKCLVLNFVRLPSKLQKLRNGFHNHTVAVAVVILPRIQSRTHSSSVDVGSTAVRHTYKDSNAMEDQLKDAPKAAIPDNFIEASDLQTREELFESFRLYENFVTEEEETSLFNEIEPYLKRLKYEASHWDDAIHGYRETERKQWTKKNQAIIQRVRSLAFPPDTPQLAFVHVLDVRASGMIRPHVDSVRFCGSIITGINMLSTAVMRLTNEKDKTRYADVLLSRRSLYIMQGRARYDYAHEVLGSDRSFFRGEIVPRERRISIICRNEPPVDSTDC